MAANRVSQALDRVLKAVGLYERVTLGIDATLYAVVESMDDSEATLATMSRRGEVYYRMGKHLQTKLNFPDALRAFRSSETGLADRFGALHPYVVAAVVQQAYCAARLRDHDQACLDYARALRMMSETGQGDHELAKEISEYLLARRCMRLRLAEPD